VSWQELGSSKHGWTKDLIFVVGNSRSGTTMMGRILGRHPSVFTLREMHFFEQLWSSADKERHISEAEATRLAARLLAIQEVGYLHQTDPGRFCEEAKEIVVSVPPEVLTAARIFEAFLLYEATKEGKSVPCDQTPRNVFYIGDILELYPEARVVNIVRDARDVLLSQKRKWKRPFLGAEDTTPLTESLRSWVNYHPITISKLWNSAVSAADSFADHHHVYSLRFEDLLADPVGTLREVCGFVGISFDDSLLEVPQIGSSSKLDQPDRNGIDTSRAGNWHKGGLSPTEIFLCQKLTGSLLRRHGYPLASAHPDPLRLCLSILSFPIKLTLALLLNLRRMRSIKEAIRRRLS
jgi:omega-hydroxy-beta-dihydromenaquinone-9 sulfotransferase